MARSRLRGKCARPPLTTNATNDLQPPCKSNKICSPFAAEARLSRLGFLPTSNTPKVNSIPIVYLERRCLVAEAAGRSEEQNQNNHIRICPVEASAPRPPKTNQPCLVVLCILFLYRPDMPTEPTHPIPPPVFATPCPTLSKIPRPPRPQPRTPVRCCATNTGVDTPGHPCPLFPLKLCIT